MPAFIGRQAETDTLERSIRESGSALVPVYGRRRVGKSELILHFMKRHPGVYFLGKQAPASLQIREFLEEASAVLDEPVLADLSAENWSRALDAVVGRWKGRSKLIIALDEFQWIVGASPELPSILQEKWDRHWKKAGNIVLILCGSYVGFMEREVLGRRSPLFGRRTAQILLRPFGYREAAGFHPGYSVVDRARTYFLCGGIPYYLQFFSDRVSVEKNIERQLLEEHAALYREPDFLLREELREMESYHAVLLAIAAGDRTVRAISKKTEIGERSLHYYLKQLTELGYVHRRYPMTGRRTVGRTVRYDLDDPLLRFWFRFVFPNSSYGIQMGPARAFRDRIRPNLPSYFGSCFERLCQEALPRLYQREGVSAAFEVGEYWDRATQIDVVGVRDDGWIDLGECRWGAVRSGPALLRELETRARAYPNPGNATLGLRLFTQHRVRTDRATGSGSRPASSSSAAAVSWHDLEDIYT